MYEDEAPSYGSTNTSLGRYELWIGFQRPILEPGCLGHDWELLRQRPQATDRTTWEMLEESWFIFSCYYHYRYYHRYIVLLLLPDAGTLKRIPVSPMGRKG